MLDTKVLQTRDGAGLQLWVPTMKAPFPLDEPDLVEAPSRRSACRCRRRRRARAQPRGVRGRAGGTARPTCASVETRKRRRRSVLDGCMVELTDIIAGGRTTWSVAVESPDPDLVLRTVDALGLAGRPNTCVAPGLKALLGWGPSRFAVIDVGTNSVKFLLGDRRESGDLDTVAETAVVTRLGEGLTESGRADPAAMARTADAIDRLVSEARDGRAGRPSWRSAPRACDRRRTATTFLDAVNERCGVVVEVISGTEEARLAYRAAVSALPLVGDRLLVFDSGGGSSQFTFGHRRRDRGAVQPRRRRRQCHRALRARRRRPARHRGGRPLGPRGRLRRPADRPRPDMVIAIGGTSTNLAAHRHRLDHYDPDVVHGDRRSTLAEVDRQIEIFRQLLGGRAGVRSPGLQPARAEVILAGPASSARS